MSAFSRVFACNAKLENSCFQTADRLGQKVTAGPLGFAASEHSLCKGMSNPKKDPLIRSPEASLPQIIPFKLLIARRGRDSKLPGCPFRKAYLMFLFNNQRVH